MFHSRYLGAAIFSPRLYESTRIYKMKLLNCNCHISFKMSPRLLTTLAIAESIASHVTHPKLIKRRHAREVAERMILRIECLETFERYSKGVRRGGSSFSAGPVHGSKRRPFRMEGGPRKREDRSSKSRNAHERNVCTRKRTSAPPIGRAPPLEDSRFETNILATAAAALVGYPRVSLASSVCEAAYIHTYISAAYMCHEYFDAPRDRSHPIDKRPRDKSTRWRTLSRRSGLAGISRYMYIRSCTTLNWILLF